MDIGRRSGGPVQHADGTPAVAVDLDSHVFPLRADAMRFLAQRVYTYDGQARGFDLYRGERLGECAMLWQRDNQWCVSFWQE